MISWCLGLRLIDARQAWVWVSFMSLILLWCRCCCCEVIQFMKHPASTLLAHSTYLAVAQLFHGNVSSGGQAAGVSSRPMRIVNTKHNAFYVILRMGLCFGQTRKQDLNTGITKQWASFDCPPCSCHLYITTAVWGGRGGVGRSPSSLIPLPSFLSLYPSSSSLFLRPSPLFLVLRSPKSRKLGKIRPKKLWINFQVLFLRLPGRKYCPRLWETRFGSFTPHLQPQDPSWAALSAPLCCSISLGLLLSSMLLAHSKNYMIYFVFYIPNHTSLIQTLDYVNEYQCDFMYLYIQVTTLVLTV